MFVRKRTEKKRRPEEEDKINEQQPPLRHGNKQNITHTYTHTHTPVSHVNDAEKNEDAARRAAAHLISREMAAAAAILVFLGVFFLAPSNLFPISFISLLFFFVFWVPAKGWGGMRNGEG